MKHFRTVLSLLLTLSLLLSCLAGVSAATPDIHAVEEETPSALNLGALSQEFKAAYAHKFSDTDIGFFYRKLRDIG